MGEALVQVHTDANDLKDVLDCILSELKSIKSHLAQPNRENGVPGTITPVLESLKDLQIPPGVLKSTPAFSPEDRTQTILHEALRRYRADSVPSWSTLYGTNVAREEFVEDLEIIARDGEWTSITGDCWKIPNDNRVSFCFPPWVDPKTLIQVRNFLLHYHKPKGNGHPKGENFNIWDWFDTGISAYWFPGKRISSMPQGDSADIEGASALLGAPTPQISHLVAPWRRIINLQGLTTLENSELPKTRDAFTDGDLCPFFLSDSGESIFQRPIDEMIAQIVKCHLRCTRVSNATHAEMNIKDCVLFHVTFYEILPRSHSDNITELWPCGDLYSDDQQRIGGHRQIRESALTLIAVPSRDVPRPKSRSVFWTMICLRPSQFPHLYYSEQVDDLSRGQSHEMIDDMSNLVHKSLVTVVSRWDGIAQYFDELLSEKRGLLNPEYHDSLLTDDKTLSRSKRYFWAIEFLKEAGNSIVDNIQQTQRFLAFLESNPPDDRIAESDFNSRVRRHRQTLQKLKSLETRFRQKKEEVVALRDGLFSASAVTESRASTQLGENIKLLTFVSIFFLPLSFCASLWSVNNSVFSLAALAVVMPVTGLCTYIIVFNLDTIALVLMQLNQTNGSKTEWRKAGSLHTVSGACQDEKPWLWNDFFSGIRNSMRVGRTRRNVLDNETSPISGDLRNVHVEVQVDVESCSAS